MKPRVAIRRCTADATSDEVRGHLAGLFADLGGLSALLGRARKIMVKPNIGTDDVRTHLGHQVALTDPRVLRGTVAAIRAVSDAEIVIGEATTGSRCHDIYARIGHELSDLAVRVVDLKDGPFTTFPLPQGLMFDRYVMSREFVDVDAVVSIAKMKSHVSTGATLCLKNLFGMTPTVPYGSPRRYLHAPVRLPRVLVDIATLFPPVLSVIDGIVGQDGQEWHGTPNTPSVLVAGTNVVATDAVGMRLMGMDPTADYGVFPYHFDRNPLALAGGIDLGPVEIDSIEVTGNVPLTAQARFTVNRALSEETVRIQHDVGRQIEWFRGNRSDLLRRHAGQFVAIADGEVIARADSVDALGSRGAMGRRERSSGILIKQVVPAEADAERLAVYAAL